MTQHKTVLYKNTQKLLDAILTRIEQENKNGTTFNAITYLDERNLEAALEYIRDKLGEFKLEHISGESHCFVFLSTTSATRHFLSFRKKPDAADHEREFLVIDSAASNLVYWEQD